ncbi:MAG TPA: lipopolysaccharide heptosyltransferase II [Pirellulales bacterium]|jgi:heptosyltransferase-2|nr:lipopolysaccharide heptosyltransferase II [Pirellulales bacterium]
MLRIFDPDRTNSQAPLLDESDCATGDFSDTTPIAVFAFPRLGDFIMCHSLIQLLRQRYPNRPIDVVARRPGIEIAPLMPEVREAFEDTTLPGQLNLWPRIDLARRLRNKRYRSAYVVSRAWKAALIPAMAGIPERIGWWGEGRFLVINRPRWGEPPRHTGTLTRAAALGVRAGGRFLERWPAPKLVLSPATMREWRSRHGIIDDGVPILAVAPGASALYKAWPCERFAVVAKHYARKGWRIWIVGDTRESGLASAIASAVGNAARVLIGNSVLDLACAIRGADVFLGNDSGPFHTAAALGKPCLGVFGPTDNRPINSQVRVIRMPATASGVPWPEPEAVIEELRAAIVDDRQAAA